MRMNFASFDLLHSVAFRGWVGWGLCAYRLGEPLPRLFFLNGLVASRCGGVQSETDLVLSVLGPSLVRQRGGPLGTMNDLMCSLLFRTRSHMSCPLVRIDHDLHSTTCTFLMSIEKPWSREPERSITKCSVSQTIGN